MLVTKLLTRRAVPLVAIFFVNLALSAEFMESDIEPTIRSVLLTGDIVAIEIKQSDLYPGADKAEKYFAADRDDFQFHAVSKKEFSDLLTDDHYFQYIKSFGNGKRQTQDWWISDGFCENEWDSTERRTPTIGFEMSTVEVSLHCDSSVSDARFFDDEVWITTYHSTEFFDGSAEGLLIVPHLDGMVRKRIDVGPAAARSIVRDPWSSDRLVLTDRRLTVVAEDHSIKAVREPVHRFDSFSESPTIVIPADILETDPLAVIAYHLGEEHYEAFYQAVKESSFKPEPGLLSSFKEQSWHHKPRLPKELAVLLANAEPEYYWRRFACMLAGELAERLCSTPIEEWSDS